VSILAKLTVTPLLYVCGFLLAALVATGAYAAVLDVRLDAAQSAVAAATAERGTARAERDAWKVRAGELTAANAAYGSTVATLQRELSDAQREAARVDAAGRAAVAAAQAAAADAERTLARMAAQFQKQARVPDCARALDALVLACPAMEGY
jgi:type IV secretory pathway TrbL component